MMMWTAQPDKVVARVLQADRSGAPCSVADVRAARLAVLAPIVGTMAGVAMSVPLWLIVAWVVRASVLALSG